MHFFKVLSLGFGIQVHRVQETQVEFLNFQKLYLPQHMIFSLYFANILNNVKIELLALCYQK